MKLASIIGADGKRITIGTKATPDGRRLYASNGDDVHPDPRPYQAGWRGTRQAAADIEAMWGAGWVLEWTPEGEGAYNAGEPEGGGYATR